MQLKQRWPYVASNIFTAEETADLLRQISGWHSKLDLLVADHKRPDQYSSAVFLRDNRYLYWAKVILNASSRMEAAGGRVNKIQRQIVELREKLRRRQSSKRRKELKEQVGTRLKESKEQRLEIARAATEAHLAKGHLNVQRESFNKHLSRVDLPLDSLLRPEALLGHDTTDSTSDETATAHRPVPGSSKSPRRKRGRKYDANGIDPKLEPELWLKNLPAFVWVNEKKVNKKSVVQFVLQITSATPKQLVSAVLYYGYEIYEISPIARYLGKERRAVQDNLKRFQNHASKQDPNWAEQFRGQQDVFRGRMATPRPK